MILKGITFVRFFFFTGGGGRDEFAQGGSQEISELDARFEKLVELLNK